jgi:hypothetical protein
MNTIIIPFVNYNSTDKKIGEILHNYILSRIHKFPVDNFIFIGTRMDFENETRVFNGKTIKYIGDKNRGSSHQQNIEDAINTLNDDDKFIVTDSDLMIYDYSVFTQIFNDLDEYDIVSNLDTGTRILPTYTCKEHEDIAEKDDFRNFMYSLSIMRPNQIRRGKTRFAATLFGCSKSFFNKNIDDNLDPHLESMEAFSRNVAKNFPNVKVKELLDPRFNLIIEDNKYLKKFANHDDDRCDENTTKTHPYYHVRNFGESISTIQKYQNNQIHIDPNPWESQRLLAWFTIVLEKLIKIDLTYLHYTSYVERIREDSGVSKELFDNYMIQFKEFYRTDLL